MSIFALNPMGGEWSPYRMPSQSATCLGGIQEDPIGLGLNYGRYHASPANDRPPLRSHKSFSHQTPSPSNFPASPQPAPLDHNASPDTANSYDTIRAHLLQSAGESLHPGRSSIEASYGTSAPESPVSQRTSTSVEAEPDDQPDDDDELPPGAGDPDEDAVGDGTPKTAAERRAEKRKMKRFRLTHNQTRFLMSEFARQAHPDAAQRERLSREIPGLSPRQVQVWFQNRRAKLKRLTSDDRERMMKSRALPDDFDMTQALHSPFAGPPFTSHALSSPIPPSPASYSAGFAEAGAIRPLMIDGVRRPSEDSNLSPNSLSSAYGTYYTPPGSHSTSENLSPISPVNERSNSMSQAISYNSSPRSANPFIRSSSFSTTYHSYPQIPRLQIHDRMARSRAESLASPLRTSMSYTGNALDYGVPSMTIAPASSHLSPSIPTPGSSSEPFKMPRSAEFPNSPIPGFPSSGVSRPRLSVTAFSPGLELGPQYRPLMPFSSPPQALPPHGLEGAPLAAPPDFSLRPSDSGFGAVSTNAGFMATYYTAEAYYKGNAPAPGPALDEQSRSCYSPQPGANPPPEPLSGETTVVECDNDAASLQPTFSSTSRRRSSVQRPIDYNTTP